MTDTLRCSCGRSLSSLSGKSLATPEVIIIHETVVQSLLRDAGTFGMLVAMVGLGIWLDNTLVQSIGAVMWIVWLTGRAVARSKQNRMSTLEARRRLDEIEARARS